MPQERLSMRKIRDVRNTMQQDTEQARGRDIAKTSVEFGLEMI
jgi:hypothetical protein